MARELRLADTTFGWIFGSFALGYAVFMIPSGYLVDRYGPRRFLLVIVSLWSALTIWTGFTKGGFLLVAIRFLFGMAEAGAYPAASRAIYAWLRPSERGLALGLMNTGSRVGAAAGLSITTWLITRSGWRGSFYTLGAAGFVWAACWFLFYRDRRATTAQLETLAARRERSLPPLFFSPVCWLILFQYFCNNFTLFLNYSWLLPYLQDHFGLPAKQAGVYAGVPLYFGALATWTSGAMVDWLYGKGFGARSRAYPAMCGFALAAAGVGAVAYMSIPTALIACFALATFGLDLTASPSWTVCSDVGRERTGTVSGAMNMAGSLGSFASSFCFPYLLTLTGNIQTYCLAAALLNLLALASWRYISYRGTGCDMEESTF